MWKPYTIVRDGNAQVEYRYATVCSYWLYGTIALLVTGLILENPPVYYLAFASIAAYFVLVTFPGFKVAAEIRRAAAEGEVTIRGSRWSRSNPLTFVIRKSTPDEPDVSNE